MNRGDNEEGDAMDETDGREDSLAKEYTWRDEQVGEDPETIYIRQETRREMLESMTEKQRQAFILYYKYGYTQQEIAEMMMSAVSTVNQHLQYAVDHARKIFF